MTLKVDMVLSKADMVLVKGDVVLSKAICCR